MKNVWRFGTRWDEYGRKGTSIFSEVFLKYEIAFSYTQECLKMKEGDLIAFSDGHDIIAIGKSISPSACLDKFDIDFDEKDEQYFQDTNITGCRVKIIPLSDEDSFSSKIRKRFCSAPSIQRQINNLWEKYSEQADTTTDIELNLFHWATKELSQDAFLAWMIRWGSAGNFYINPLLYKIGKSFLECLIRKFDASFKMPYDAVIRVFRQYNNIDIAVKIKSSTDNYAVLIEDKIHAEIYNDLEKYLITLKESKEFQDCDNFFPILIKTGDQCSYEKATNANYHVFLREDFLKFFSSFKAQLYDNDILSNFYDYLVRMEEDTQAFLEQPIGQWTEKWMPWKGFYSYIAQNTLFRTWHYVANASGGFLCSRMAGKDVRELETLGTLYWQIESNRNQLCLKLGEVYSHHSEIRDKAIDIIDKFIEENEIGNIEPPARKGCGCYMTLKIVKQENWLGRSTDTVNLEDITKRLQMFASLLEKLTE